MTQECIDLVQGSEKWLALRKNKITASDMNVIMGVSKYRTPLQLFNEKHGITKPQEQTESMRRGLELEPMIRDKCEEMLGFKFEPKVIFHSDISYLMASLDGWNPIGKILEIKTSNHADHETIKKGLIPEHYYPQVQMQIECTGLNKNYYCSYFYEDYQIIEVERDQEYIDKMLIEADKFWQCLINFTPPPITDRDYVRQDDQTWADFVYLYNGHKTQMEHHKKRMDDVKQMMIDMSEDRNSIGAGIKLEKIYRIGNIEYAMIPSLQEMDLEPYRKPGSFYWSIKEIKDENE